MNVFNKTRETGSIDDWNKFQVAVHIIDVDLHSTLNANANTKFSSIRRCYLRPWLMRWFKWSASRWMSLIEQKKRVQVAVHIIDVEDAGFNQAESITAVKMNNYLDLNLKELWLQLRTIVKSILCKRCSWQIKRMVLNWFHWRVSTVSLASLASRHKNCTHPIHLIWGFSSDEIGLVWIVLDWIESNDASPVTCTRRPTPPLFIIHPQ